MDGARPFIAAYDAGWKFESIVLSEKLLKVPLAEMIARRLAASGVPIERVSPEDFRSVCQSARASGIGAIVSQRWSTLDQAKQHPGQGWLVIESIQAPGNLGTILRTAAAAGLRGCLFLSTTVDPFATDVLRATMGALFSLAFVRCSVAELDAWSRRESITLVGLTPEAKRLWTEMPTNSEIAIVVGNERTGLTDQMREILHTSVGIPMANKIDSINVAVAAGLAMFELVRQRPHC